MTYTIKEAIARFTAERLSDIKNYNITDEDIVIGRKLNKIYKIDLMSGASEHMFYAVVDAFGKQDSCKELLRVAELEDFIEWLEDYEDEENAEVVKNEDELRGFIYTIMLNGNEEHSYTEYEYM